MQRSILILILLIYDHTGRKQKKTILQFIGLSSNMKWSLGKVSKSIDINPWIIDQSANNLNRRLHGCIVDGCPITLIPIIDIQWYMGCLLLKKSCKLQWLIFQDSL